MEKTEKLVARTLENLLAGGEHSKETNLDLALNLLKTWQAASEKGDVETLLEQCSPVLRDNVALLLRDILSIYPNTLVACPILGYWEPAGHYDPECEYGPDFKAHLPTVPSEDPRAWPCENLKFLGWLDTKALYPNPVETLEQVDSFAVPLHTTFSALAIFATSPAQKPEVFESEIILPATWWAELFAITGLKVRLSTKLCLPYPDALEAARFLAAAATDVPCPNTTNFLGERQQRLATLEGLAFQKANPAEEELGEKACHIPPDGEDI